MPPQRPNLLLLMSDQHRFDWFGAAGAHWTRTPNIDRLAAQGILFTQCTVNSPLCAPSRISLATGLQPHRVGALDNSAFLPRSAPTYYQALRDNGYRVGFVGKIDLHKPDHYNGRDGNLPITYSYGFTDPIECEGKMHAGQGPTPNGPYNFYLAAKGLFERFCNDYHRRSHQEPVWYAADSVLPTEDWEDCYIGRRASELLEHLPDESPWHLFVSFVGPHDPWDPPTEFAEHFRHSPMPDPISDDLHNKPHWHHQKAKKQGGATPEDIRTVRRQYTAALETIDTQIGLILQTLEHKGQLDNTYILYCSDHGEMLGDHGLFQKSVHYEPALRIPLIVTGPNIKPGHSSAQIELSDLHPTLLTLAGIPPATHLDAQSFHHLLHNPTQEHRTDTVSQLLHCRALRTKEWKLVENYNDTTELYNLREDPHELNNLAEQHPDIVARMHRRLVQRLL